MISLKVVPQFGIAKLVNISPISLGLMNGGYIYSIHEDYKPTYNWGAPSCMMVVYIDVYSHFSQQITCPSYPYQLVVHPPFFPGKQ